MIFLFLLLGCVISTSLMTLFSYALANLLKEQLREPELLNTLAIRANVLRKTSGKNHPLGWTIHYAVGLLFVGIIEWIRFLSHANASIHYYMLAGALCGLAGIVIWYITLKIHPNPPKLNVNVFFIQLIFAHIVFGVGVWVAMVVW